MMVDVTTAAATVHFCTRFESRVLKLVILRHVIPTGESRRERVYDAGGVRAVRVGPWALPDVPRREPPPAQEQRRRGPVEDQRPV